MPRIKMRARTPLYKGSDTDPDTDPDSPRPAPSSSGPSVSIIHLSVAQVLAQGRAYTGKPPLGPLAFPRELSYTIVDPDPQLPLSVTPGELYATVGGELKKIRPLVDCEEARGWMGTAEGFQAGTKMGGRRVKVEAAEEEEEDGSLQDLRIVQRFDPKSYTRGLKRRYGLRDTPPTRRDINPDPPGTPPAQSDINSDPPKDTPPDPSPPPRKARRRKLERRARSPSTPTDNLVVPDLVPDEVEPRKLEAARKNQALKRGLGLKSLLPHDHHDHDHHGKAEVPARGYDREEVEEGPAHNRNKAEDLAIKQLSGHTGPAGKTITFTRRLVKLRKVLRKAMEALTESNLEQLEPYFEVDWMIEDIEAAVQGAISRKNLTDRAKGGKGSKSYPGLSLFTFPSTEDLPYASKNRKITELMMRLTPLVTTLYRAVEVLNEPYLLEIERLFDVDWMIEDVCRAITGAVSCRRLNEKMLKKVQWSEDEGRAYVH